MVQIKRSLFDSPNTNSELLKEIRKYEKEVDELMKKFPKFQVRYEKWKGKKHNNIFARKYGRNTKMSL